MKPLHYIILFVYLLIIGCSNVVDAVSPPVVQSNNSTLNRNNHWGWGFWTFHFSEDHSQVEVIPVRKGDYHYCVTQFMESWPCPDCLKIGKPQIQSDGTVKLNVTLKHPFKNQPIYTGFDVRGMVYFPHTTNQPTKKSDDLSYRTKIWTPDDPTPHALFEYDPMPIIYSRAAEGGGEILNTDGFSCYLVPWLTYSSVYPIYSYNPGWQGKEPTPQTTITPYKLFASDSSRRMFQVNDTIMREYHIALPPGEFCFGYAVDASWWFPDNIPVTNPAVDFPLQANSEDPWLLEYEQLAPLCDETVGQDIFKVTVHHRGIEESAVGYLYAWTLTGGWYSDHHWKVNLHNTMIIDDFTKELSGDLPGSVWSQQYDEGATIDPGHHFAILIVKGNPDPDQMLTELRYTYAAQFAYIDVGD